MRIQNLVAEISTSTFGLENSHQVGTKTNKQETVKKHTPQLEVFIIISSKNNIG